MEPNTLVLGIFFIVLGLLAIIFRKTAAGLFTGFSNVNKTRSSLIRTKDFNPDVDNYSFGIIFFGLLIIGLGVFLLVTSYNL